MQATRFLLVLAFLSAAGAQDAGIAKRPEVTAAIRVFDAWLKSQMAYRDLPGVAVGVIHDQQLVWSRGYGFADRERHTPATPRTLFRMASHTKLFTTTAILQLRDAGKLRLDDPVVRYLPWFRVKPASDDDPPITVEELLTHSSGLPREAAAPYWTTFEFPSEEDVRRTVPLQSAAYSPQVRWKYSNLAFTLAGMIVEAVSGERYSDYVTRHVLAPLGMSSSNLDFPADRMPELATGYGRRMPDGSRKRMPFTDCRGIAPAAGLSSNLEDMARFVSLQFRTGKAGGSQILSGASLREMHRVRVLNPKWTSGNGLGFAVWRAKDKTYFGHGGSLAGYKTQTIIQPDDRVGVVVLSNGDDSRPREIADRAMQIIGGAVAKATAGPERPAEWDPAWSRFAGLYRSIWADGAVVEMNRALVFVDPQSDDPEESMLQLKPLGGGAFRLEGDNGGAPVGEVVTFLEDSRGVTGMKVGDQVSERVREESVR